VPGAAALNHGGRAVVGTISCPSAGNCGAAGIFSTSPGDDQGFVVSQTHGTWGTAREIPGFAALNRGGNAAVWSQSCPSAGNCTAGGLYTNADRQFQAFVVDEANGRWGAAREVPGTRALNRGGYAGVRSVSCPSPGNCSAVGFYLDASRHYQAFVADEVHGRWDTAQEAPGTGALNQGGSAQLQSVSCASAGDCSAGGGYLDGRGHSQAFVAGESNGTWKPAETVPGTTALNQGGKAAIASVSCALAGACSAGGYYTDSFGRQEAFVVSKTSGIWGIAQELPNISGLNYGYSSVTSVSCPSPEHFGAL